MAQFLLDTDICIFLLKDKFDINKKVKQVGINNCFISEITLAELYYGAYNSEQRAKHLAEVKDIEHLFQVVPIYESLEVFGNQKAKLRKSGSLIADFDLLIGSSAISLDLTLVTNNEKHFDRIEGLQVVNWIQKNK